MSLIHVNNLVKNYGTKVVTHVLKGISLTVEEGEFMAIMGRSGAGKSTLLYQMSALDYPTSGEVIIGGENIHEMTNSERTRFRLEYLGYIFQDYALLPEFSAVENVMLPLIMLGYTNKFAHEYAAQALTDVGLGKRLDNRPSQLSGGEQQRVSVARAIAHKPKILFADEPTANLDSASSENILNIFEELHAGGQTIVMITHEGDYANYAERKIIIEDGKVVDDKKVKK